MVHKQKRGASYRIDRTFAGVGRIALSSGTDHPATFRRLNAMLTGLAKVGRIDVLAGIRDGTYAPLVVLHYYERGQLDKLPTAETSAGLLPALRHFAETHECSRSYRSDLWTTVRHLERATGAKTATVNDLPRLVRAVRETMRKAEHPVAFNRLRAHALAFASSTTGELSPLWTEVKRVHRFKKAEGQRPKKLQRRPLTVAELDAVCEAFVDVPVYGGKRGGHGKALRRTIAKAHLAAMARALATTGMRPQEYWERDGARWVGGIVTGHVFVEGTKTRAARRPTLAIVAPVRPACGEQLFRREFAAATTKALRTGLDVYSLRRTFASFCESAGVVPSRREAYMGHGPKTVGDLYLQTLVLPFVEQDGQQVERWMETEREKAKQPVVKLEVVK